MLESAHSPAPSFELARHCRHKLFAAAGAADVIITTDPIHVGYIGGYRSILQDMAPYPQALVATRDRAVLITGASDAAAALETLGDPSAIYRYGQFYVGAEPGVLGYADMPPATPSFAAALQRAVDDMTRPGQTVGIDGADPALAGLVAAIAPNVTLTDCASAFRVARATKLPGELSLLRRASAIADDAMRRAFEIISPDVSELDVAAEIGRHMIANGGVPKFIVVTSGKRSSRVDAYPIAKAIGQDSLVRLDIGCSYQGYYSDMARTVVAGTPSAEQSARYDALLRGEQAQLAMLKPGVAARDVFAIALDTVRQGALPNYERNHCGHGIGLNAHEYPALSPSADAVLEAGMVFCVETPYYQLGWGGMMVEDTAIITPDGYELLTTASRALNPHASNGE